ncbi:MAG: hypothetical protein ABI627_18135, partial [Polyangiaceae bacterium]
GNSMAMGKGMGMADGTGHMGAAELMPDAKASVQRTDKGARMVLTPNDASQLDTLRQRVRIHQQRMQSGQCWVHQDQASTEAPQPTK